MEEDVIVKVAVPLMGDDRRALGHVRPEPAGMIEVVVGVHLGSGGMGVVYTATDPPVSVLASIPLLLRLQLEFFSHGRQESEVKSQGSG